MHSSMKFMLLSVFLDYECSNSTCNLPVDIVEFCFWHEIPSLIIFVTEVCFLYYRMQGSHIANLSQDMREKTIKKKKKLAEIY